MRPYEYEAYDTALAISMHSKGGLARAASMTPQERSECASKAAKARWGGTGTPKKKKGRRLAPRRYKELPHYLANWLYQNSTLRHNLFRTPQEFMEICERTIELALEKREDGN